MAKAIMFQGTASSVGKSTMTAALCRILRREGLRVASFKAQNMSAAAVDIGGGLRISAVQAVQAQAAGVAPTVDMNPLVLLPASETSSEVVLLGRSLGVLSWGQYAVERRQAVLEAVQGAAARLSAQYEVIVAEGAGSPVEINLRQWDLANAIAARLLDADVLLVGDIDRGGVFASLVGTLELMLPEERARVKGLVINRFRGDPALFEDGVRWLEERTGLPVVGVVPYLPGLDLDDPACDREAALDRLADHVRSHIRLDLILGWLGRR